MTQAPNLIGMLYRETFRNDTKTAWIDNLTLRQKFMKAKRFILDESMSEFLGELATRAFVFKNMVPEQQPLLPAPATAAQQQLRLKRLEALRVSACAPHEITWIEYDLRRAMSRSNELLGRYTPPEQMPKTEGWLIEQRGNALCMSVFTHSPEPDARGFQIWTFPVMYCWTINDEVPPWRSLVSNSGASATGIYNYDDSHISITNSPWVPTQVFREENKETIINLIKEWVGVMRRAWAFLACIDDIPVRTTPVLTTGSFLGKGRVRSYLDYHTITINVPRKSQPALAARTLGSMVKRAGGPVRAHWRRDWRNPVSPTCPAFLATGVHLWTQEQACSECGGRRILVHEHVRGDTGVGFNVTDYIVKHVDNARP
jgi:hypothetical protein